LCLRRYSPSWATTNAGRDVVASAGEPAGRMGNISLPFPLSRRQAMDELLEMTGPRSLADQLLAQLSSRCFEDGDCDRQGRRLEPAERVRRIGDPEVLRQQTPEIGWPGDRDLPDEVRKRAHRRHLLRPSEVPASG